METLINTKLEKYSFIGEAASADKDSLEAVCSFEALPFFTLIEAMAQLASLHFKRTIGFKRQTFLLRVKNVSPWPVAAPLSGVYALKAGLLAKSRASGFYRVTASGSPGEPLVSGDFYISSVSHEEFKDLADR